jgi:hypothetical protein
MFLTLKKISGFVLLLIVALPLLFSVGFLIKQKYIQHQVKERLENACIKTISQPLSNVIWVKQNKEISINGKLFDVKSFIIKGATVVFTGVYDEDEDDLNKSLENFVHKKNNPTSPINTLVAKFFSLPINTFTTEIDLHNYWHYIALQQYHYSEKVPIPPFLIDNIPPKI